jgi:hypothetical protein
MNGNFGFSVASAGDVNGDGFADVVVGANSVSTSRGKAYVYLGSPTGLATSPATTWAAPDGGQFGHSVASAGDVNGDGYADVVVGAIGDGTTFSGRAYVYLGGATGIASSPVTTWNGPDGGQFGYEVASAGDVNGDGYADVVVGAPLTDRAYVYLGSATTLASTPATPWYSPDGSGSYFGWSVAYAGDVNGDGYADVVVGAQAASKAYVYLGSATGLPSSPATTWLGPAGSGTGFGFSVASAGDMNGDGYSDVVVGAYYAGVSGTGQASVYLGSATGLASSPTTTWTGPDGTGGLFGIAVAGAGDVNRDGYADVVIGAYGFSGDTGKAYVYLGSATGPVSSPATSWTGPDGAGGNFGNSVASAGDGRGDGFARPCVSALRRRWFCRRAS